MSAPDDLTDADRVRQDKHQRLRDHGSLNPHPERVQDPLLATSDFFDADDLVQVKYEMLRRVAVDEISVRAATEAFGFTRPVYYQARSAYDAQGLAGLLPAKRGPKGGYKLTEAVLDFVEQVAAEEDLSSSELARRVAKHFDLQVHPRSIERARKERRGRRA